MSKRKEVREAVSAMLDAGRTPAAIVKEFGCSRHLVYTVKKLRKGGKPLDHATPPRKRWVLTPQTRANIKRWIRNAPTKSLRRVSKESSVPRESIRRVVQEAGWRSLRKIKVPLISEDGRRRRAERAAGLLNSLKSSPLGRITFFSDEKNFVIDPTFNAQND